MVTHNEDGTTRDVGFLFTDSEGRLSSASVSMDLLERMEQGARLLAENDLTDLTVGGVYSAGPTLSMRWNIGYNRAVLQLVGTSVNKTYLRLSKRFMSSVRASAGDVTEPICVTCEGDLFLFDTLWLVGARITGNLILDTLRKKSDADLNNSTPIAWLMKTTMAELKGDLDSMSVKQAIANAKLRGLGDTPGCKVLELVLSRAEQKLGGE